MSFSLVSTVFNEGDRLSETIRDLERQTIKPDEIIITDAGSKDGTYEKLLDWSDKSELNIRILQEKNCNVARGRNLAIEKARNNLIVSTDFGCRFKEDWLDSVTTPFKNPKVKAVGGAYAVKEEDLKSVSSRANYILTGGYKIQMDDNFIPSSRSIAYYKDVWEKAGGYPEWLSLAADDLVFGKVIKSKGIDFTLVKDPKVFWGRHEKTKGYVKESYRYGLGDGESRVNLRNFVSNVVEILCRYFLLVGVILFLVNIVINLVNPFFFIIVIPAVVGLRSYINAFRNWWRLKSSRYHFGVFLCALILVDKTRLNYIKGYIKGYFFSPEYVKKEAQSLNNILG